MLSVTFAPKEAAKVTARAYLVADDLVLPVKDKFLTQALATANFKGKKGETLTLVHPSGNPALVILAGIGKAGDVNGHGLEEAGGSIFAAGLVAKVAQLEINATLPKAAKKVDAASGAAHLAFGADLRSYRFDKYRTKEKAEDKPKLKAISIVGVDAAKAKKAHAPLAAIADSINFARDLVSEPANILYPATLAAEARKLSKVGVKVEVLGEAEMKKLGMGSLLGVGQGSIRESQLVVMQYYGGKKGGKPIALVGKGVTFDTGGISIKPALGMEEMKWDMGGSAAVIGTMRALAARGAKVNAVGVVGLVENMPDGNAQRPGDVVTSMSGQTIEVLNTDAEGRLVLADALWYTQERFKPSAIVDLATLTGAIIISLGSHKAGLFSNNDKISAQLSAAGDATGEKLWRMPMGDEYDAMINCDIADMKNISDGREAGSTTAAQFLQRFIQNDTPWAHLDIAGVAWSKKATAICPRGAVGWGVRLLNNWVATHYEGKK